MAFSTVTFTDACLFIEEVSSRTFTLETAKCVDTVAPLTQAGQFLAFIYVCSEGEKEVLLM